MYLLQVKNVGNLMLRSFVLVAMFLALQACSSRLNEVQEWVVQEQQKSYVADKNEKFVISVPESFSYDFQHLFDPFDQKKFKLSSDSQIMFSLPKESFSVESLVFVGILKKQQNASAILKTKSGFLFLASVGDVIGLSKAKIERVTDRYLEYSEVISDGIGNVLENRSRIFIKQSDFYKDVK